MNKLARTLVLPLALVAVVACDKGKSGGGGGGGNGATGAAGAAAIAPAQGGLKKALAAMPKDTDFILGLDFAQARKSALWKKYEPEIMKSAGKDLEEFKQLCGFDPLEKLSGMLIGGRGAQFEDATMFVRGFEKGPTIECMKKHAAKEAAEKGESEAQVAVDGDYVEMTKPGEDPIRFMFVDDKTMMIIKQGEGTADKATLAAAAAAKDGEGLTSSGAFTALLDKTQTGSTMWFVANGNSPMFAQMPPMMKFKAVFGHVNVGSGIDGEVRMRMGSADDAKGMVTMAKMGMEEAKKMPMGDTIIKGVNISSSGEDAVIKVKFDQQTLENIVKMAMSMRGGGF